MIEVKIYTKDTHTIPTFVFKSFDSKEMVLENIFSHKAYCFKNEDNKLIAINTDKILFVEVVDLEISKE